MENGDIQSDRRDRADAAEQHTEDLVATSSVERLQRFVERISCASGFELKCTIRCSDSLFDFMEPCRKCPHITVVYDASDEGTEPGYVVPFIGQSVQDCWVAVARQLRSTTSSKSSARQ